MKNKIFIYSFIIAFILISISLGIVFAVNKNNTDINELEIKTKKEISLLEEKIIAMMNKVNNISFYSNTLKEEKKQNNNNDTNNKQSSSSNKNEESDNESSSASNSDSEDESNSSPPSENIKYEVTNNTILTNRKHTNRLGLYKNKY